MRVVAGVLVAADGRVLLAQRPSGRHAGRWEFPGGKVEGGESAEAALRRELAEELGIAIGSADWLIDLPFAGERGPWSMTVFEVRTWQGVPQGREGQALRWVPCEELAAWPMPPADLPVAALLRDPWWYLITPDLPPERSGDLERGLARLCATEERLRLQWRLPRWPRAQALALLRSWLGPLRRANVEVFLNGRPKEAVALGCGVHLRSALLGRADQGLRAELPGLTASCHDPVELEQSLAWRPDALLVGPVKPTATHPGREALGWQGLCRLRAMSCLPIYALGGLGRPDLATARRHGAQGIAAIRGLWPDAGLAS
ncbi:MAG: hypothetical protein KatS3mg126_1648 [Lysobacteraceae bacterium]|nr:MAG: hypothetical protein KatS3mg126_1648 [Xanthomonadaceae bacterium]